MRTVNQRCRRGISPRVSTFLVAGPGGQTVMPDKDGDVLLGRAIAADQLAPIIAARI